MRTYFVDINADFTCKNCGSYVTTLHWFSGVIHRNHCPYCLHSRHLDLFKPGDRLSACRDIMVPVGLTLKQRKDKFSQYSQGELMLVHHCKGCEGLSINRIAADDDPDVAMQVFETNLRFSNILIEQCQSSGVDLLQEDDRPLVEERIFGLFAGTCGRLSYTYN